MITRREMVKAGARLAAILASGRAPAAVVRSMLAARASICGGKKLPYKKRLQYIESTGSEYINTGIKYRSDMSIRLKYTRLSQGASGSVIMATSTTAPLLYFAALNRTSKIDRFVWRRGGYSEQNYARGFSDYPYSGEVELDAANDTLYFNGEAVKSGMIAKMGGAETPYESAGRIFLFSVDSNSYRSVARIYHCSALAGRYGFDLIPVIDNDDTVCMYDRVTRQNLYTPRGAFIAGPDAVSAGGGGV